MSDDTIDTEALAAWISSRVGDSDLTVQIDGRPSGGFSAETLLLSANSPSSGRQRYVVRLETPEPAVYPPQSDLVMPEIEIQFRIMNALGQKTDIPVAGLIGYEHKPDVLGTPFFVMHHVDGVVPIESPPYSAEGFFTQLSPSDRTSLISNGLAQLANLHAIDASNLGLEWLTPHGVHPGSRHLLNLWKNFGIAELRGRTHPLLESAWTIIEDEVPVDASIGLCWGDPRPGNIIWNGTETACLTDFEAACFGPPEFDLGWWLMFDRTMHELAGIERLPGDPTREEQRQMYFRHAGRDTVDTFAHELFAAARYCVIVVRVMNRLEQRGLLPADSMVWLENPASDCLKMVLNERS